MNLSWLADPPPACAGENTTLTQTLTTIRFNTCCLAAVWFVYLRSAPSTSLCLAGGPPPPSESPRLQTGTQHLALNLSVSPIFNNPFWQEIQTYLSMLIPLPLPPPGPVTESRLVWPGLQKSPHTCTYQRSF